MYLSVICLQKSINVYEAILGEEILKEDLFFKLNYMEMSCVSCHLYLNTEGCLCI